MHALYTIGKNKECDVRKIIAFANRKGGVGKTTSAVNVAAGLADVVRPTGGRVLLVDIDAQGNAAKALGIEPGDRCVSKLLLQQAHMKELVMTPPDGRYPNLFVIPASDKLRDATAQLMALQAVGSRSGYRLDSVFEQAIGPFAGAFEYIIFDCPPTIGLLDQALYNFVTDIVVPARMAYLDSAGSIQHLGNIADARDAGAKAKISYILPTFWRPRELVARQTLEGLVKVWKRRVAKPIPQSTIVEQSQAIGQQTIWEYAADSPVAEAYRDLVGRLA
jgi:chromosome partitioning protein